MIFYQFQNIAVKYSALAITFFIMTAFVALILRITNRIFKNQKYFIKFDALKKSPKLLKIISILYYIFLLIPVILLIVIVVLLLIDYGRYPGIPFLFYGLFIFLLCIPSDDSLFYYKILLLSIVFLTSQFTTLFLSPDWNTQNQRYSFFAITAIFLILNGILNAILIWSINGKQWALDDSLGFILQQFVKWCPSWEQKNPPLLLTGGIYSQLIQFSYKKILQFTFLIFAWVCLIIYAIIIQYTTNLGTLGAITAIAVASTDLMVYLIMYMNDQTFGSPIRLTLLTFAIRICLFGFTAEYWFMGYCLLYLILMVYIQMLIIDRRYPNFQKAPTSQIKSTNILKMPQFFACFTIVLFSAIIFYLSNQSQITIPVLTITIGETIYPFWAIGIGSILISISLFFYMISLRILVRKANHIKQYENYYFGSKKISQYIFFLFLAYATIVIYGAYFYVMVKNVIILLSCIFIPLIYETFIQFYKNWEENDFLILGNVQKYNKKAKKAFQIQQKINNQKQQILNKLKMDFNRTFTKFQKITKNEKILKQDEQNQTFSKFENKSGDQSENQLQQHSNQQKVMPSDYLDWRQKYSFFEALRSGALLPTDKQIIISIPIMISVLVTFSLLCYFVNNYDMTTFTISAELLFIFLTFLPIKRFFSTLEKPQIIEIVMFALGISLNFIYGAVGLAYAWRTQTAWIVWWAFVNPLLLFAYAFFGLIRDYGISIGSLISGTLSVLIGFGMGIFVLITSNAMAGIIIIAIFIYFSYFLITYFLYLKNQKILPQFFVPVIIILTLGTAIGASIALYVKLKYDGFIAFSVTYLVITLVIGAYSLYLLINDLQNSTNFFSPYGDVFKFEGNLQSCVTNKFPTIIFSTFLILLYFYSLLLQIFIAPVQIGVSFSCLFEILIYFAFSYFQTYNSYSAGKLRSKITQNVIKQSWNQQKNILVKLKTIGNNQASLINNYKQSLQQNQKKFEAQIDEQKKTLLFQTVVDLQNKIQKQKQEQLLIGINLWMRIIKKTQAIQKKKWYKYINFITQEMNVLMSFGIIIILNNLLDAEGKYYQIKRDYNALTAEQKLKFDYNFKLFQKSQQQLQKKLQQQNKKQDLIKQKRQEKLLIKLKQNQDIDDSNLPIEKMKDSPKKLQKILNSLKSDYIDNNFKADKQILPQTVKNNCAGFKRPSKDTQLLSSENITMDVKQGQLGDCYLISSIGIANKQYISEVLGIGKWENPKGCYMVKLNKLKKDIYVIIDDQFPVTNSGQWLFGRCQQINQLYVNVIQKAYAKLYGSYKNIEGGKVHLTLSELTGGFPEEISLKKYQQSNTNQLYDKLLKYHELGYLMGAGSPQVFDSSNSNVGIVPGHAYQILKVKKLDENKLIKMRNPHGSGGDQYNGDWSDNSQKWTQRLIKLLGQQVKADDGAFWISVEDFVYLYKSLYICKIFNESIWKKTIIQGQWKGEKAAGLPSKDHPSAKIYKNPHYGIKVTKKSTLFVQLQQKQLSNNWKGKNCIFFLVQKNNGKRITTISVQKQCGRSSSVSFSASLSGEILLQAPSYPYTFSLLVACLNPDDEGVYNLVTYCDDPNTTIIGDQQFDC